jgi:hypothetical protein
MSTKTYISLDLDFFNQYDETDMSIILEWLLNKDCPITVVDSHEDLIDHCKKYDWTNLINFDAHSDYKPDTDREYLVLDCSSWIDFVANKKGKYTWVSSKFDANYGRLDCSEEKPFDQLALGLWKETEHCTNYKKMLKTKDIVAIGISLSFFGDKYTDDWVVVRFLEILEKFGRNDLVKETYEKMK